MALGDKMSGYSVSDAQLRELEDKVRDISYELCQPEDAPFVLSLSANIGVYISRQIQRIRALTSGDDVDLAAYFTRNIFEATLLLEYMVRHAPKIDSGQMVFEMLQDHLDIVNGAASLFQDHPELVAELEKHRESIASNTKVKSRKLKRTPRVSELAKITGATSEYIGMYKLYSKYTHPTAYLLFSSRAKNEAESLLEIFRARAHFYATQAQNTYQELMGLFKEIYA